MTQIATLPEPNRYSWHHLYMDIIRPDGKPVCSDVYWLNFPPVGDRVQIVNLFCNIIMN